MKKITIEELNQHYYPFYYTHNRYDEGGRKIHICEDGKMKGLCGFDKETHLCNEIIFDSSSYKNMLEWMTQPDPDLNICQRCKEILLNKIETEED